MIDNQTVHKGDLLFSIDPTRFRYAVDNAKANLVAAEAGARAAGANISAALASASARKAEYEMRQQQAERRQQLGDIIAKEVRTDAVSSANSARASWQQAQAGRLRPARRAKRPPPRWNRRRWHSIRPTSI